jgi:hypothetical protein
MASNAATAGHIRRVIRFIVSIAFMLAFIDAIGA